MRIDAGLLAALVEPGFGARRFLGRWQIEESQVVARDEMDAFFLEIGLALGIDQTRGRIGKRTCWIDCGLMALRLDEDAPAGTEAAESVVDTRGNRDQLGSDGAIEIGTTKRCGALERPVLVEHDTGSDQRDPGQIVGEPGGAAAVFGKVHHRTRPLKPTIGRGCADACARPRRRADRVSPPRPPRNDRRPR